MSGEHNKVSSIRFSIASRLSMSLASELETHSSIMSEDFSQSEKKLMEKLLKVRKSIAKQYGGFEAQKRFDMEMPPCKVIEEEDEIEGESSDEEDY